MFNFAEELKKNPDLKEDDVRSIKEWMAKQPHLPETSDEMIVLFLHSCYYKIEFTKTTIDRYFTIRTEASEIFSNRDPLSTEIQETLETIFMVQLPEKTADGHDIFMSKFNRTDPKYFNGNDMMKTYNMQGDICYRKNGTSPGVVYLVDMDGSSLSHILKLNITSLRHHFIYLQEGFPVRLKGIHLLNSAPFVNVFMNMIKPFVTSEVLSMMHLHDPGSETVYDFVPKSSLPKDYGGNAPSLAELHAITKKSLEENQAWFKEEELYRVNESKRFGRQKSSIDDSSLDGSFKKLEID